jgi:hypothetical protein
MSEQFTEGIHTGRGETIPADQTLARLDVSAVPEGRILLMSEDGR